MSKVDLIKILERFDLFNVLSDYQKARLAAESALTLVAAKSNLSALFDTSQYAYFVVDGVLALRAHDRRETPTILDLYRAAQFADVSDLISSRPEDYNIIAAKTTTVLFISKSELAKLMSTNLAFNKLIVEMLAKQAKSLMARHQARGTLSLADQIKNYVIDNSNLVKERRVYKPDVDYSIVCLLLGCTRATASRTIQFLVAKGFLKKEGKSLVLADNLKYGTMVTNIYGRESSFANKKKDKSPIRPTKPK